MAHTTLEFSQVESPPRELELFDDAPAHEVPTYTFSGTEKFGKTVCEWQFVVDQSLPTDQMMIEFSGFGGVQFSSIPYAEAVAQRGIGTLTIESIRDDGSSASERLWTPHHVQVEAMHHAITIVEKRTGIGPGTEHNTRLLVQGHSMGGETATSFCEDRTKECDALILFATIGFGSPSILSLLKNVPQDIIPGITEELIPFLSLPNVRTSATNALKVVRYFVIDPLRTSGEVISCLTSDLRHRVTELRDAGLPVIYVQPEFDALVQGGEEAERWVDLMVVMEGAGHIVLQAKPHKAAHFVLNALNALPIIGEPVRN